MKNKKYILIQSVVIVFILSGCAKYIEASRQIMGTSVKPLYESRAKGESLVLSYDYQTCYKKVMAVLKKMKAYIYLHSLEKRRIVAMNFKGFNNTTQVGIFFTEVTPGSTKIEISCLSQSVLKGVSKELFSALSDKKL